WGEHVYLQLTSLLIVSTVDHFMWAEPERRKCNLRHTCSVVQTHRVESTVFRSQQNSLQKINHRAIYLSGTGRHIL
ncbi:hypothetical protein DFH28DRAFT_947022, partial [Melampsora americana]